jgi:hypothetical protein
VAFLASSCADVHIYRGIKKLIDISILAKQILHVRSALLTNTEKIVCMMLTIDDKYWLGWFGKDYYEKVADAFKCSNQQKS